MACYADLSGERIEILKEMWKQKQFPDVLFWGDSSASSQKILSRSVLTLKKLIHCVRSTSKRIYLNIVLIYNLDGEKKKSDINAYEYLLMTSGVFLHWKKHSQIIFNGNFLYFYFCKGRDACRFFYITKWTLIFALHVGSAWAWHSILMYISFAKDACKL